MAVKSRKNFFDPTDFDEVGDSMDLWWNTIQDSFQFDAISKKREFVARVISPPVPIGANSAELETFANGVRGNFTDTLPKFVFRARMIEADSHHVFWPDPCDPEFIEEVGGQQNAIDWIQKHVKVMAINATEVPRVGDTIRIKLNKQGIYTSNPENAIMVGSVTSLESLKGNPLATRLQAAECETRITELFKNYTGGRVGVDPSKIRPPDYYYPRICGYFTEFESTATKIGIPPAIMAAFVAVESSGNNLAVRFEPHLFNGSKKETKGDATTMPNTPSAGGFSRVASETNRGAFETAFKIDKKKAIRSASFGSVQVLGQHLLDIYGDPDKAKTAFFGQTPGDQTISKELVVRWFKGRPAAVNAANSGDFAKLARLYNGPSYAANAYDINIENASNSVSKCPSAPAKTTTPTSASPTGPAPTP